MSERTCEIPGCANKHEARGWCDKHYLRWRNHGDPLGGGRQFSDPEEAFAYRTEWQGNCLVWTGGKGQKGYGILRVNGKKMSAHRYAWERVNGPIPDGMFIDHKDCYNAACVTVEHLRLADNSQNLANRSGATKANKSSGVRNVYRHGKNWQVAVTKKGKNHIFGTYSTIEEAAEVAELARKELFGEYAGRS